MKKTIMILSVLVLVFSVLCGTTLAYLVDTDDALNTFTVGNVKIDLHETDDEGNPFEQNQTMNPGGAEVDKLIFVENTGTVDAWLWIEVWMPDAFIDADGTPIAMLYNVNSIGIKPLPDSDRHPGYSGVLIYNADTPFAPGEQTDPIVTDVFIRPEVTNCTEHTGCYILGDGLTHYSGAWDMIVDAVGFQADGVETLRDAVNEYYGTEIIK